MSERKVVVIGSGLGGLACGAVLAREGYDVTVLEQTAQIGGCLQCFYRKGVKYETGMHFIGSAKEGQTLDRLLKFLEVKKDIQLSQLDSDGYDIVSLEGEQFAFANGKESFIDKMSEYFPRQRDNIAAYYSLVEKVVGASSLHSLKVESADETVNTEYQLKSINEVIDSVISDPLLAKVLVGNLPLYAAEKDKTPFSTHAFIVDFYNQSAFRIVGGSDSIAKSLESTIIKYGGRVLTYRKVTKIICNDHKAIGVEINGDDFMDADFVISDVHPMRTLEMTDSKLIRPAFRKRIENIPQTIGVFSVYLEFNDGEMPYMNHNFFGYNYDTPWGCECYDKSNWPKGYLYMHLCHEPMPSFAKTGVILSYMDIKELDAWSNTTIGHRGADYEDFKLLRAEKLIASVEKQFPGFKNKIKRYYTSTPLTYRDYTGTERGSMYGVAKDINIGMACRVPHKMKIPNVYQTGQNINSHGILGVIVGSVVTCGEFLTMQKIFRQIADI